MNNYTIKVNAEKSPISKFNESIVNALQQFCNYIVFADIASNKELQQKVLEFTLEIAETARQGLRIKRIDDIIINRVDSEEMVVTIEFSHLDHILRNKLILTFYYKQSEG